MNSEKKKKEQRYCILLLKNINLEFFSKHGNSHFHFDLMKKPDCMQIFRLIVGII